MMAAASFGMVATSSTSIGTSLLDLPLSIYKQPTNHGSWRSEVNDEQWLQVFIYLFAIFLITDSSIKIN